jgi:hypothetical protein
MGLLSWFLGSSDEEIAEDYLRAPCTEDDTPGSIRHYRVEEVTDMVELHTGARLTDDQTAAVIQRIRDDYGMGPIAESNMSGYANADDYPDYPEEFAECVAQNAERDQRNAQISEEPSHRSGGFLGWLLG